LPDQQAQLDPLVHKVELEILDPPDHRAFKEFKEYREKLDPLAHKEILAQLDLLGMLAQLEALDLLAVRATLDQLDPQVQILRWQVRLDQRVRKVAHQLSLAQLVHKAYKVFKAKLALLDRPDPLVHRETVLLVRRVRLVRKAMKLLDPQVHLVRLVRLAQIQQ
jgi:hypothetical protein